MSVKHIRSFWQVKGNNRISHRSHKEEFISVDHVFFSNPSEQIKENLPPIPDWTNLVYQELYKKIVEQNGNRTMSILEIFKEFDQDKSSFVTREEFKSAINKLGFTGEGAPALLEEEIDALIASADANSDGLIDYKGLLFIFTF